MEDKFTLFAALVCALAIVVVTWWEYRPSFFWCRYLLGLEKITPDEMSWNEVVQRIHKRAYKAYKRHRECLSNGIIVTRGIEQYNEGAYRKWLMLFPKRSHNPCTPLVAIDLHDSSAMVTNIIHDETFDAYQWMMEQMSNDTYYEIAKRAYICEQKGQRGDAERAAVEQEYIQWIARKFI